MLERGLKALEGNKRLLEKRRLERGILVEVKGGEEVDKVDKVDRVDMEGEKVEMKGR